MNTFKLSFVSAVLSSLTVLAVSAQSASRPLVHGRHTHPEAAVTGGLAATQELDLTIGLPLRDQAGLTRLLQELYDPASPNYRHWLTPQEFTARFGPTAADYAAVVAYAQAQGFAVQTPDPGRVLVEVHAKVADVERAWHVHMRKHQHPTEAREFFAPDAEPTLDLAVPVQDIGGLDNFVVPRPAGLFRKARPQAGAVAADAPVPQSGSGSGGTFAGKDFRAAYAPGVTLTGAGQSVGLFEFGGYYSNDIVFYENTFESGNQVPIVNELLSGESNITNNAGGEEALDIEMQIAMAPGMTSLYYYFGGSADTILSRIASDNTVHQVSASWLYGTDGSTDGLFQQLAAQGIAFFNSAGDSDAYPVGSSIDACCSSPYVISVGGTTLSTTGPGGTWTSEKVWNWGGGTGGSGGISQSYAIPSWQTGINMGANLGSTTMRNIPDVSLTADNIDVYYNGGWGDYGGTSCAAPLWAGFMALVNQQGASVGLPPVGSFNPAVYAIGKGAGYSAAFHDITTGNNFKTASPTNFPAVAGYDLATGWGTPKGQATINALAPPTALVISPFAGFNSAGGPGGPFTVNAQVYGLTNISATTSFSWSLASTSAWLTVSSTGGTMATNGSTNVTVSLNSGVANGLAAGTYAATVAVTSQSVTQSMYYTLFIGTNFIGWSGGANPNGNWSGGTNWAGNTAPTNGANLLFSGSTQAVNTNDYLTSAGWVQLNPGAAFTVGGNALTIAGGLTNAAQNNFWNAPVVLGANQNFDVASNTSLTAGGAVSGGFRLTKTGAGTLILTGTNTYTGPTTISAGTLLVSGAGTLGTGTYAGNLTNNSAFIYGSSATDTLTGVISGPGTLEQQGMGNLTLGGANTYTGGTAIDSGSTLVIGPGGSLGAGNYTNVISGGGGFTYNGTGTQILSRSNTFTGNLTVNSGTLSATAGTLGGYTALGQNNTVTVNAGGTLNVGGVDGTANQLGASEENTLTVNTGGAVNFALTGSSPQDGCYLGTLNLNGGTVASSTGAGPRWGYTHPSGVINVTGSNSIISAPMWLANTTGKSLTVNAATNLTISGVMADYPGYAGLPFIKAGAGTLTLSVADTYTGPTTIAGGTLALTGSGRIAGSAAIVVATNALLDGSGMSSPFTLGSAQTLTAGSPNGQPTVTNINGNYTSGGTNNIAGSGTNGVLTINGNLGLTGGVLVYDFGAGADQIALSGAGRTLSLGGVTTIQANLGLNNGVYTLITNFSSLAAGSVANLAFSGTVVRGGTAALAAAAPAVTLTVSGGAAANLVWQGTNGLTWNTAVTNWLNSGTGLPDQFYSLDNVSFDDTGMAGVSLAGTLYPGSVTVSSAYTNFNFGGTGSLGGSMGLTLSGAATLSITNNNTYTGGTTISAGVMRVANPNALGNGPLTMTGGTLDLNGTNLNLLTLSGTGGTLITDRFTNETAAVTHTLTVSQTVSNTFAGTINNGPSNAVALAVNGPGYLLLTGANTYGGGTTVNGGTLEVTGNSGAKTYTVAAGGTLKIGYSVNSSYGYAITVNGNGATDPSGFYLKSGASLNLESALTLQGAPSRVRSYGGSPAATLAGYDINYTMLSVAAAASGSVLETNVNIACSSYGYRMNVAAGTNTATGDLTVNGVISGSGSVSWNGVAVNLEKYGTGSVLLTNASTATGYGIAAGTLILAGANNRLPSTANVVLGNGGTSGMLQLNGVSQTLASLVTYGSGTASAVQGGSATPATLTINNAVNVTNAADFGGEEAYQNNLALVKTGAGQLVLSGQMTYTGGTTISAGSVVAGTLPIADGAVLTLPDTAGTLAVTNLTLGAFTGSTVAFTGFAGAAGAPVTVTNLTVNGVTKVTLAGTYGAGDYPLIKYLSGTLGGSGSFTAQAAGLPYGMGAAIVTNAVNQSIDVVISTNNPAVWTGLVNGSSTATWDNGVTTNWTVAGLPNYFTNKDNVRIDDTAAGSTTLNLVATLSPSAVLVTNNAKNFTLGATGTAALTGTMALTKQGAGVLTITESNAFTGGVTIGGGAVNLQNGRGLNTNTVTVAAGAELQVQGGLTVPAVTALTLAGTGTNNTGALHSLSGTNGFGGTVTLGAAARINCDSGVLTLTNGIAAGTNALTLGGSGNMVVTNVAPAGSAALVKDGSGTVFWTVAAGLTNGPVTVNAGTWRVTGSLGTNTVTVATNGTLAGNGVIRGPLAVQAGGLLQPGLGGGDTSVLTVSNGLTLAGNVVCVLNRTNAQNASGITGLAGVTYGGLLTVSNAGPDLQEGDTFTLFRSAGYGGSFAGLTLPALTSPLIWNTNNLTVNGSLAVVNGTPVVLPPGTNALTGIVSYGSSLAVMASGVPGYNYALERATNLVSPVWVNLTTNVAGTNGVINATDGFLDLSNGAPGAAFYRFLWVQP